MFVGKFEIWVVVELVGDKVGASIEDMVRGGVGDTVG